jgi:cytochrome bd ubiquinol oxidase subunit I
MQLDPLILSRIQFALVISYHVIFPAFTLGLAARQRLADGERVCPLRAIFWSDRLAYHQDQTGPR